MQTSNRNGPEIAEQAAEFVLRLEGAEEGVERELSDWLARSPQHLKELMLSIAIHQQIRKMGAEFQAKTRQDSTERLPGKMPAPGRLSFSRPVVVCVAAAVVLVVCVLFALYQYYEPLLAFGGNPRSYRLSDGSLVRLKGGSAAYTDFHGNARSVGLLRGEAFFDVEHDVIHPFTVIAGSTIVRAVGTAFDVHLMSSKTTVTVKTGRIELQRHCESPPDAAAVSVRADHSTMAVTMALEAGEQASVSRDGCVRAQPRLDPGALDQQLAWSHQKFDFMRKPLSSAVNQLNRYNRRQLLIRDPAIRDVPFSGGFDSRDIDSFIKALQPLGIKPVPQQAQGAEAGDIGLIGPNCQWNGVRCSNR
jgi:transmembrane sensor